MIIWPFREQQFKKPRRTRPVFWGVFTSVFCGVAVWSFTYDSGTGQGGGVIMPATNSTVLNGAWIVQKVKNVDLEPFDDLRFDFDGGTLYGSSPCRSFTTTFGPDLDNLMFSPFQTGGGLCDEETMVIERDFMQQIGLVNRMEVDGEGQLVMYNFDQPILWAKRLAG
ncbi:META domain-containing protein [Leisingera sp. ANG59]|uniref:META domain-containing protein n=1 Tax=Leisingera sp. ANG59 TaxID=2675221 RepID=UPI0015734D64|nr:META domain-containing protein [Leisingera sp. ANG59]NSY37473.1 META domain-containing protein [Leisingera sp. ANG59]